MRSRWFHKPELHSHHVHVDRKSSWLEVFYDIIFVSSFVQLSKGLGLNLNSVNLVLFALVFSVLWFSWLGFTLFSNRFNVDDLLHRGLVFLQLIAVASVSAFASGVLNNDSTWFSLSYAAAQLIVALLFLRTWWQADDGEKFSRYWSLTLFLGTLLWLLASFLSPPAVYGVWVFGLLIFLAAPFSRKSQASAEESPADLQHLSRRFGFLTIIVLGEVFLTVMSTRSETNLQHPTIAILTLALSVAFSIWWIYFDDIVTSDLKSKKFSMNFWVYAHLPLHGGIVALGVALQKAAQIDFAMPLPSSIRWLLSLSLSMVFFSIALLDVLTERKNSELNGRIRFTARLSGAALILLLAPMSAGLNVGWYLCLMSMLCMIQVLFDLIMAPFSMPSTEVKITASTDVVRQGGAQALPRRIQFSSVIRKNTPNEFRSDLYYYFIEGSWSRFLILGTIGYILVNVFFAGVYMLQADSISGARSNSFADAFYFSVQTFSTIGYGQLNPNTDFSNIVVVIESAIGLAGVALATGLIFTKVAKPRPGILFSRPVLIAEMNGKPHLMFRVGNTRGNEIVSAEMTVSVLRDEISKEGQHLRRMYDLNLVRARSPFFGLSWVIFHEIDTSSPFFGIKSAAEIEERILQLSCILTGHDSTYGQTIYKRHVYLPSDFRVGAAFVDILGQLPDGTMVVDYSKFHQVK